MTHLPFKIRPLVSLTLLGSFLTSLLSGIALYLRPEGALARWLDWSWLGLDKKSWEVIHIGAVLLLLLSGLTHTLLNWKPLWSYLRKKRAPLITHWREALLALVLTLLFTFGPLWHIPPFTELGTLRGAIKNGETQNAPLPPVADAETLTLEKLADLLHTPLETLQQRLLTRGLVLPPGQPTLSDLALANQLSPALVFLFLSQK